MSRTIVKFVKNKKNGVWVSEWFIYLDGKFDGFIYKCRRTDKWDIFCLKYGLSAINPLSSQKTFSDAKKLIREFAENDREN